MTIPVAAPTTKINARSLTRKSVIFFIRLVLLHQIKRFGYQDNQSCAQRHGGEKKMKTYRQGKL
jgi:hypothetical protein